ncbi:heavy-metal-associated domain-containing protein [Neofamilia massiliensis]|uniref:heavy-metal-associated domain-containing protein n=1 Tax=Neofamilia massiliensis TaxID=1673724 RepID=UPI0006BB591A|nr:cation transporter [Neofamilia massiliensis]
MEKIIYIEGMACGHCKTAVEKALGALDGVSKVEVSLEEKLAKLILDKNLDDAILKNAVEEAGYEVVEIK